MNGRRQPLPLPRSIEEQCNDAARRLRESVNRSAGQHLRAMRKTWAQRAAQL